MLQEPAVAEGASPPLRKRKHGLRIMQGLMDEVEIVSGSEGTTIVMSKLR
jgi:anti-sigma regulatory factor (Ser/Thr protein kinase)